MSALKRRREAAEAQAVLAQKKARLPPRSAHVPREVFALLARGLQDSPRSLLRLSVVCTCSRDVVLKESADVWYEVLKKNQNAYFQTVLMRSACHPSIVRGIPMRPYPNFKDVEGYHMHTRQPPVVWFLHRSAWPSMDGLVTADKPLTAAEIETFAQHAIRTVRVQNSPCCGVCRGRVRLHPVWGLGMQVCHACLKDNLVSGAALFYDYGLNFNALATRLAGWVYCFHFPFKRNLMSQYITYNPVDFDLANAQSLVFFWKPHLARVLDLDAARRDFRDPGRTDAARKLTSSVRALFTRVHLRQTGKYSWLTSHRFFVNAPASPKGRRPDAPHNVRDLSEVERALLYSGALHSVLRKPGTDSDARARKVLQESFLGYRGWCTLPRQRHPALALEKLRAYEATRAECVTRRRAPTVQATPSLLKRCFDLAPALLGAN